MRIVQTVRFLAILSALGIASQSLALMPPWLGQVRRALEDELRRSMDSLSIESLKRPYYLEYTLRYRWSTRAKVSFGGLLDSGSSESARLTVGIRVGSPERDNTNFLTLHYSSSVAMTRSNTGIVQCHLSSTMHGCGSKRGLRPMLRIR